MSDTPYKVSAILCHHKGTLVYRAIDSLLKSKGVEIEIILATSDETLFNRYEKEPRFKQVVIKGGPAGKRNVGFRFAQYPLVAFFDDDIEVKPWAVYEMAKSLQQDGVGMVFGKLLNMEFTDRFDEAGSYLTSSGFLWARAESGCRDVGQFEKTEFVLAGKSASCMIHRRVFVEVGMYDPSYEILAEETDLAWRVWLYGYRVLYIPSSVTLHAFNTKFKPPDMYTPKRVYFNGCRNYLSMLMTNLGDRELWLPVIVQLIVWTAAGMGFLITGKREAGIYVFNGIGWFISHINIILSKRRKVQGARRVSDRDLMPIIRRNPPVSYYIKRFFHYIKTGRHG